MSDIARSTRSQNQRWAAPGSRHDRLIAVLQVVLPIGIGILTAFLVMAPLFTGGDVSFVLDKNKVEVAKERLKLQTARYRGQDTKGRQFQITAGEAVQKSAAEPIVQLYDLAASIELQDGPAQIVADRGRYDMGNQQVAIDGPIRFTAAGGYVLGTRDATVDLRNRTLESGGAVSGTTPLGTFSGDRLTADLEARTVALKGNARLRIVPKRAK
ncbi:LPS export ABC transporter periplasmic protein LptC [Sphingomonas sp. DT-204]|uniref:LPS export ABC transporter periplasmic protein LptC n=1 Tax=Sphingomonas sp. DT-204 TaxID=3396166 RepID=UPI003F1CE29D